MNKINAFLPVTLISLALLASGCGSNSGTEKSVKDTESTHVETETTISESSESGVSEDESYPLGVQALLKAYPDNIKGFEDNHLIFADGSKLLYDDGKKKDFEEMLDNSSPKDMFYTPYVLPDGEPAYLADAGRSRNEELFKKMYGSSPEAVKSKLVNVKWLDGSVQFTSVNGAAEALAKVNDEIARHPELHKYLKSSGTFYWREVRGAKRLSAHSYGVAFDIGVDNSSYWKWKNPKASETDKIGYENKFPRQIAEIFQKHGFIWGGAWYHYDTMHFEYRPEILEYARLAKK